ncbi:MAG: RNA polymerase sigma factor [Chloroflexota bacterium]
MDRDDLTDSATLYAACRDAEIVRQTAAYEALWPYLYRVALQVVRDQPDAEALAQDCAQESLLRIVQQLDECREPAAFHGWVRRIAFHAAIDALRQRKRLIPLDEAEEAATHSLAGSLSPAATPDPTAETLRALIGRAPISERSRRVVIGRWLDDQPDEKLAQAESALAGEAVLPSHIQVTRAKDIARLKKWDTLRLWLGRD